MGNTFYDNRRLEMQVWNDHLRAFAADQAPAVRPVFLTDGTADYHRNLGYDFALFWPGGREVKVELKCERNHTGNLFLETWSNKRCGWGRDGWMFTCKADELWYFFADTNDLYRMKFRDGLWVWAFDLGPSGGNIYRFREVYQRRHRQANDTFGHIVPVSVLRECVVPDLGFRHARRVAGGWEDLWTPSLNLFVT